MAGEEDERRGPGRPRTESLSRMCDELIAARAQAAMAEAEKEQALKRAEEVAASLKLLQEKCGSADQSRGEKEKSQTSESARPEQQESADREGQHFSLPDMSDMTEQEQGKALIEVLVNTVTGSLTRASMMNRPTPDIPKLDIVRMGSKEFRAWRKVWEDTVRFKLLDAAELEVQMAYLHLSMTPETREICDQLCTQPGHTVKSLLDAVADYLVESVNVTIQRKCFYERQQRKGESIAVFMLLLREMAQDCKFGQ